ncbi:hypothetical protein [Chitinophaga pinensis]|uniref:Uncharacterized protein n=1 Tax=Chitinophaga pinensis (strain ATCC 43595 / DSM 2588 / LMG 13176 / NBRC 15968 / NCIMB 11800 / UQM 2034) TaxID=485918 RepID=A0A979G3D4_CHIPD|nr:hypothetical protein [Chitinophaga pinensis]ACU60017.1 hypothetical protein Cpin_2533 [Chitinophaga pinensis DSM 2588]
MMKYYIIAAIALLLGIFSYLKLFANSNSIDRTEDYIIVERAGAADLEEAVRFQMTNGFQPLGGVSVNEQRYTQAMVK